MDTVNAVPVFLYILILAGMAVGLLVVSRLLNPRQFVGPVQKMPYESGMDPIHDTRRRFDVRFHLIAIAFLVFDVEVLFLYPWAVAAKRPDAAATYIPPALRGAKVNLETAPGTAGESHDWKVIGSESRVDRPQVGLGPSSTSQKIDVVITDDPLLAGAQPVYGISAAVKDGLASDRNIVFGGAAIFFLLLALGFVYDWRKGVFQWR